MNRVTPRLTEIDERAARRPAPRPAPELPADPASWPVALNRPWPAPAARDPDDALESSGYSSISWLDAFQATRHAHRAFAGRQRHAPFGPAYWLPPIEQPPSLTQVFSLTK